MTKHTPMVQLESIVYFNGGGFDLRGTPHPNELASFIVRACNSHEALVEALETFKRKAEKAAQLNDADNIDGNVS